MRKTDRKLSFNGIEFILYQDDNQNNWLSAYEVCNVLDLFPGNIPLGIKRYFSSVGQYLMDFIPGKGGKILFIHPLLLHHLAMFSKHEQLKSYQETVYRRLGEFITYP